MTRFADDLYDDLMRDHGRVLADTRPPVARRSLASHRVALTAGVGGLAAAATAGSLVVLSGSPAYALTTNQDGSVKLAVYQQAGIAQANAKFRQLGDRVVVVPVRSGCPSISSLPKPAVPLKRGEGMTVAVSRPRDGSITVNARGVPAGDIMVVAAQAIDGHGLKVHGMETVGALTSGKVPSCVSLPPAPGPGSSGHTGSGPSFSTSGGSGPQTSG